MPVGKEIGKYKGTFSYVRLCERNGSEEVVEGSYKAKVSGELNGTAVVESFFGLLKRERVNRVRYRTRDEARADVFDYIECFYNRKRRHGYLGNISPAAFEKQTCGLYETVH